MRWLLLAVACSGTVSTPDPPTDPAIDPHRPPAGDAARAYTADFVARANQLQPGHGIEPAGDLAVRIPGGPTVDLSNLWGECPGQLENCPAVETWARVIVASGGSSPVTVDQLRVHLVGTESARTHGMLARPWVGPIAQVLVRETPDTLDILTPTSVADLGIDDATLWERAHTNTHALTPHVVTGERVAPDRPVMAGEFPNEGGRRLLFPADWAPIAADGKLFVAAPARDVVIWTGSLDGEAGVAFRWLAQAMYRGEPHPISPAILEWTPQGFELEDTNDEPLR